MQFFSFIDLWRREFSSYSVDKFRQDLGAGLAVGALALPLVLALSVASGSNGLVGIITAAVAGLIIGALSSAPYQISGPTVLMSALLIPLNQQYGVEGVWVTGLLAGIILLLLGIFRLQHFIHFIPASVIAGFTSAIALIVLTGQINNLFNINTPEISWGWLKSLESLLGQESALIEILSYTQLNYTADWNSIFIGSIAMLTMIAWAPKWGKYLPGAFVGVAAATLLTWLAGFKIALLGDLPRTILVEDRLSFGTIPWDNITNLLIPIFSIAILIAVETILSTNAGAKLTGTRPNSNTELIAQGIGNIILPFFGGLPAAAASDRTSVAINAGGVTRMTSLIHAVVLLLAVFLFAPILSLIPVTALAGVLMVSAYRINELRTIQFMFGNRYLLDSTIFIGIIAVTLLLGIPWAMVLTVIGIAVLVLRGRISLSTKNEGISNSKRKAGPRQKNASKGIKIIHLKETLFVTTLGQLHQAVAEIESGVHTVIVSLQNVSMIDIAGVQAVADLSEQLKEKSQQLMISGANASVQQMLIRGGLEKKLGAESFFTNSNSAITEAEKRCAQRGVMPLVNEPVWNGSTALALYRPSQPEPTKGRKKRI